VRLDDVIASLQSPQGNARTLMRSKRFGLLPCSQCKSAAFNFQISPIVPTVNAALVSCSPSGTHAPDGFDASALRAALLPSNEVGNRPSPVSAGSAFLIVAAVSRYFKTATLGFHIRNSSVSSLGWYSDSSVLCESPEGPRFAGS
jgi:hypothetical protein